jgi:hypothetical protein
MKWNRSNTIGLANGSCAHCQGHGMRVVYRKNEAPCDCVFRAIFRACLSRFRECVASGAHTGSVSWEFCGGQGGYRTYSRKHEEYTADFCLVSRRMLDESEHNLFRYYFLLGADWKLCSRQLKMDRGTVFHSIYRIEKKLGRAFAELEPYALFPLSGYFAGVIRKEPGKSLVADPRQSENSLRIQLPLSA